MAKTPVSPAPDLNFRGFPQNLLLSSPRLAGHRGAEIVLPDDLAAASPGAVTALSVRTGGRDGPSLRLRLDRTAPAGRYRAKLRLDGQDLPVGIEIAAAPRLSLFPWSADFSGSPGADSEIDIVVSNRGNMAIELPERAVAGIFDNDGLEAAFADTYRQTTDDPAQLFGHWLGKLREGYGGLLKLRLKAGAGPLAPGAERTVTVGGHLPETLKSGRSYQGVWKLGPVNCRVSVAVRGGS